LIGRICTNIRYRFRPQERRTLLRGIAPPGHYIGPPFLRLTHRYQDQNPRNHESYYDVVLKPLISLYPLKDMVPVRFSVPQGTLPKSCYYTFNLIKTWAFEALFFLRRCCDIRESSVPPTPCFMSTLIRDFSPPSAIQGRGFFHIRRENRKAVKNLVLPQCLLLLFSSGAPPSNNPSFTDRTVRYSLGVFS